MKNIIKTVIENEKFNLSDILKKIDKVWFENRISDDERENLVMLAQGNAKPENSVDVMNKFDEFEKRIRVIEEKIAEHSEDVTENAPAFVVGKWYYKGDVVAFEGKEYECVAPDGVVCTWNPVEYPVYWRAK